MDTAQRRLPHRHSALLSREVDGEFVVVDEASKAAHQLTGPAAMVWRAIETGAPSGLDAAEEDAVVTDLSARGLLAEPAGITRRAMLQRTGVVVAATGLSTIALPAAVAHASTVVQGPTISISPVTGPAGVLVTITGSNFPKGGTVTVTFNGAAVTTSPSPVIASATSGAFTATFTVPTGTSGSFQVVATSGAVTAGATFTRNNGQTLTVGPLNRGGNVTSTVAPVTGSGFQAGVPLTASATGAGVTATFGSTVVTTTSAGDIPANTTVQVTHPAETANRKQLGTLTVTDGTFTASAPLTTGG